MRGTKLRSVFGLMAAAVLCAGIFVAHVWRQNAYVRLAKEVAENERNLKEARDQVALLELRVRELKRLSRLEELARERFGLEYHDAPVLVYAGPGQGGGGETVARADGFPVTLDGFKRILGKVAWETRGL